MNDAEKVLKRFELDVIKKAKTEGYDGGDSGNDASVQWNFSGALLYSVTVITTIGECYFCEKKNEYSNLKSNTH